MSIPGPGLASGPPGMPTRRAAGGLDGMRVALAQTDCVLGDVDANVEAARDQIRQAVAQGADLVVFPELR